VNRPRRDFSKRFEHKPPAVHPRMRNNQSAPVDLPQSVKQHVNIDTPGTIAKRGTLPHSHLDRLEAIEQIARAQARSQLQNPIYKISLRSIAYRRCAVKKRDPNDPDSGFPADKLERTAHDAGPPADI